LGRSTVNSQIAVDPFVWREPASALWLPIWAVCLALGWLLPNHDWPWTSFHSETWAAFCFAVACGFLLLRSRQPVAMPWLLVLTAFLALIPVVQQVTGLVYFFGSASLGALYLAGFALAMVTGQRWAAADPNQPIDGLFLAIGVAGVASVGMQLCQWLGLDMLGIWLVPSDPCRPFANLAQPNNLATLLLWACLAAAWGYWRRLLSAGAALMLASFLVLGIALTQSRTAMLGMLLAVILSFFWRRQPGGQWLFRSALVLLGFLVLCLIAVPLISNALLLPVDSRFTNPELVVQDAPRKIVYRLFLEASLDKALFGYGWANTGDAFFSRIASFPELGVTFYHTHNLFLDLVLWFGWPLGMIVIASLLCWGLVALRAVGNVGSVILFFFVLFAGVHSMLEFPLHYANFLLPCGLVIGVIHARWGAPFRYRVSRWPVIAIFSIAVLGLGTIVRDYSLFEDDVRALRFERLNIQVTQPRVGTEIMLLTQLRAFLDFSHENPRRGFATDETKLAEEAAFAIFNPLNTFNFIQILALNGQAAEAQLWVNRARYFLPAGTYRDMAQQWSNALAESPELAAVTW
jgi:hypothetical protein